MEYIVHLANFLVVYAILGLSLNLIVGYTGLFAVSHAAFYGIGAYSTAILLTRGGMNFFVSVFTGVAVAILASLLIGVVLSRFRDDYYAIVSIGFSVIVFVVYLNWHGLTKGPIGIPGVNRPSLFNYDFSSNTGFLVLSLFFLAVIYLVCRFIVKSSFGRALKAVREDESVIQIFGYNTVYYKLVIFMMGSAMAAVAGSIFASYLTFVGPSMFTLHESIFILVIIILGGLASLKGSILGALVMILLPEILRFVGLPAAVAAQARQFIYGVILVLLMLYRPQGLAGEYKL